MDKHSAELPLVPSPCRGICYCNDADICTGCGRTREEVLKWLELSNEEKLACKEKSKTRLQKILDEDHAKDRKPSVQKRLF